MESCHTTAALRSAQADQAYWRDQFQAAIGLNDRDGAAHALQMWRRYQWLIGWIEGTADPTNHLNAPLLAHGVARL